MEKKVSLTIKITEETVNKLKDAVYWTPDITKSEFVEKAILSFIGDLETTRPHGKFPRHRSKEQHLSFWE